MRIEIRPARIADGEALILRGLREADKREAWKAAGVTPEVAVRYSLACSARALAVLLGGRPACLLGAGLPGWPCGPGGPGGPEEPGGPGGRVPYAIPWLLAHDDFEDKRVAVPMARLVRQQMDRWVNEFSRLENLADPEHAEALRLLRWMGFTIEQRAVKGPKGHDLLHFWRNSACVSISRQ